MAPFESTSEATSIDGCLAIYQLLRMEPNSIESPCLNHQLQVEGILGQSNGEHHAESYSSHYNRAATTVMNPSSSLRTFQKENLLVERHYFWVPTLVNDLIPNGIMTVGGIIDEY